MSTDSVRLQIGNAVIANEGEYICRYETGNIKLQERARLKVESKYLLFLLD